VLLDGESTTVAKIMVTTPERTAFEIGRRQPHRIAVANLDSLARATDYKLDDVLSLVDRHRGARGLRRLETALTLVDPGAQSPRGSYLRLLLVDTGLERAERPHPVGHVDQGVAMRLGGSHPRQAAQRRLDAKRHTVSGEREAEDVIGAGFVVM
jgi:hypothetical protein